MTGTTKQKQALSTKPKFKTLWGTKKQLGWYYSNGWQGRMWI